MIGFLKTKVFIGGLAISVAGLSFAASMPDPQKSVPPNDLKCQKDSDCVWVSDNTCCEGWVVNKKAESKYKTKAKTKTPPVEQHCELVDCWNAKFKCIKKVCTITNPMSQ